VRRVGQKEAASSGASSLTKNVQGFEKYIVSGRSDLVPSTSEAQRKLFAIAESMKKGKTKKSYSPQAARIAKTLSVGKIKEFTGKVVPS
jgi:CHASE1-domain containing sensor protein